MTMCLVKKATSASFLSLPVHRLDIVSSLSKRAVSSSMVLSAAGTLSQAEMKLR